jgi:hypothetical protein
VNIDQSYAIRARVTHLTRAAAQVFYNEAAGRETTPSELFLGKVCEAQLKEIEAGCSHQIEGRSRVHRPRRTGMHKGRMLEWCTICRKILHREGPSSV